MAGWLQAALKAVIPPVGDKARIHQAQARDRGEPARPRPAADRGAAVRGVATGGARQGARGAAREHRARSGKGRAGRRGAAAPRAGLHRARGGVLRRRARRRLPRRHHAVKHEQAELFGAGPALPEGFVFQPDFISAEEERALLDEIARLRLEEAKYKQYTARRRIAYFGFGYDFSANRIGEAPPAPAFLAALRDKVAAWIGEPPARLE